MAILNIPVFDGGLITHVDPEDIQETAATTSINFETDVPGKLIKRQGRGNASTLSANHIDQIEMWSHQELDDPIWVYFEPQTSTISKCDGDFTNIDQIKDLSSGTPSETLEISNYGRQLRFANGLDQKAGIYQHIDREWFFGDHSVDDFFYDDATLSLPTTWQMESATNHCGGMRQSGFYYYQFVPVYDGVQVHPLPDANSFIELTADDRTIKVGLSLDTSTGDFNPRITSIRVYRSFAAAAVGDLDPVYYHITTIPVNSKADHEDVVGSNVSVKTLGNGQFYHRKLTEDSFGGNWGDGDYELFIEADGFGDKEIDHLSGSFPSNGLFTLHQGALTTARWDVSSESSWVNTQAQGQDGSDTQDSGFFCGKKVLYKSSWNHHSGEADGNVIYKDSGPAIEMIVTNSKNKVLMVNADIDEVGSFTVDISNGYRYDITTNDVTLWFYDYSYTDRAQHPLGERDKVVVNHKYSVFLAGRQFVGNVRLDPDEDAEDHENWIIFSEQSQPDILPIVNYIQIKDLQGGEITGLANHLGALVVFMERGVYRLDVPSTNPGGFSLLEAEENIGCIAPNSIVHVSGQTFFAGKDNAYVIDSGFNINPITEPIKDIYQESANLEESRFFYDPKKARILCRFGSDIQNIYCFDLLKAKAGMAVWNQLDLGATYGADIFAIDNDMNVFSITNLGGGGNP